MTIKTRFAPSPTGYLHVGGARTALYCWLFARHNQGQFVLRIEDTDRERSTAESIQAILDGMKWLGLDYDEGPFYQTERMQRYQQAIDQLLTEGKAYRCTCSKERLDQLREQQQANKQKPRYDGHCRDANLGPDAASFVVRFRNPESGEVSFDDQVKGNISISNNELDDLIIARSDGTPTYNFTVVVDDWDMKITHVIRGDDHINNTPRQINILTALNAEIPVYAHLPMILGADGKRLSKRHGAVSVLQYRDDGYMPDTLLNYLVRLGWSHGDQEIFSRQQMVDLFELKAINKAAAIFNPEKLDWLSQQYLKNEPADTVAKQLEWYMQQLNIDTSNGPALTDIVEALCERSKTLLEMAEKSRFFYQDFDAYNEKAATKNLTADAINPLKYVDTHLQQLDDWDKSAIHTVITQAAEECNLKMGKVAQPIRVAVSGNTVSPSIDITLKLLGKQKALARIQRAIHHIEQNH